MVHHHAAGDCQAVPAQPHVRIALDNRAAVYLRPAFETTAAQSLGGGNRGGFQDAGIAADRDVSEHPCPAADLGVIGGMHG